MKIVLTKHAKEMLDIRRISHTWLRQAIQKPDTSEQGRESTVVLYRKFGDTYLKVIIRHQVNQILVITTYWISHRRMKEKYL